MHRFHLELTPCVPGGAVRAVHQTKPMETEYVRVTAGRRVVTTPLAFRPDRHRWERRAEHVTAAVPSAF